MKTEIWVDGGFRDNTITWGFLVVQDDIEVHRASGVIEDEKLKKHSQIAGELKAVTASIEWCLQNNVSEVSIYYDYEGINSWAIGSWKTNKILTIDYKKYMQEIMKIINILFIKVKAHADDKHNNEVDKINKEAYVQNKNK